MKKNSIYFLIAFLSLNFISQESKPVFVIHKANSRGLSNTEDWLLSRHTFSFGDYYDPQRLNFGALYVLNDDRVKAGGGFPKHPHKNMEIISIVTHGGLEHNDNAGHSGIIKEGDVQIMSAGSGVRHSEFNHSKTDSVNFLQIWIHPKIMNVAPRYVQKKFSPQKRKNALQTIVSPVDTTALFIYQDAIFMLGDFEKGKTFSYKLTMNNTGVYLFVLEGSVETNGILLERRDGLGISNLKEISIKADKDCTVLIMEVAK
ncbi:MAG TPA: pirin family protein [Cytophagaceae bacterium]|jgi:redox-sensitive bicupin YhaK (pirin superfamily)|nr:pirin family protein [Cytophagaceae bacterium]